MIEISCVIMGASMRMRRYDAGDIAAAAGTAKESLRKQKRKKRRALAAPTLITPPERMEASLCCHLTSMITPVNFCAATIKFAVKLTIPRAS